MRLCSYFQGEELALITKILHTYLPFYIWSWYIYEVKGALDKYNISPNFFQKSWDFYTNRSVGMGDDCMLSFMFKLIYF